MALRVAVAILIACAAVFACTYSSVFDRLYRVEYLALVPNGQGPMKQNGPYSVDWIKVSYPASGKFQTDDVDMRHLPLQEGREQVGGWRGVDLGVSGAMLTGRQHNGNLYVFINTGRAPIDRGCCADTLRIFPSADGSVHRDLLVVDLVRKAVNSIKGAHFVGISHAFHPWKVDDTTVFLLPIIFNDEQLGNVTIDGVLALDIDNLKVYPTVDGHSMFIPWRHAGTVSTSSADSVFNIQFKKSGASVFQQWHGNCVQTYTTADGTDLLGITTRMDAEAILYLNPYLHSRKAGGGKILQRFGSPKIYDSSFNIVGVHNFGLEAKDSLPIVPGDGTIAVKANGGIHNLFFHRHSDGRETVTVFVNELISGNRSGVFEFDIKLVKDHSVAATDAVFATNYTCLPLPFTSMAQGGARPIGDGVYIASSGLADRGYMILDTEGSQKEYAYSYKLLYDPFVFVSWTEYRRSVLSISLMGAAASIGMAAALYSASAASRAVPEADSAPYMPL